jgi:hypothetical protein
MDGGKMSEAIELHHKDGRSAGIFYCSECRAVYKTEAEASNCHGEKLCACGKKIERRYYYVCNDCQAEQWNKERTEKENARFEKARKIPASEYTGEMVYGLDDKYHDSIESALDDYIEGQEPEYVWACKNIGVPLATTESLYENLLENMWEDADVYDLNGVEELETEVTAFNEANKSISVWEPDYSLAILIEEEKSC